MTIKANNDIVFKSHGFFSPIAKKTNYSIEDINTIYTWYVNNTLSELAEKPACQVFMKGLGILKFDAGLALRNLTGYITGLQKNVAEMTDENSKSHVKYSYITKRHALLSDAVLEFQSRLTKLKKEGFYNETYYINKLARSEKLQIELNQIYESIQRIPEDQRKRTSERGQDIVWSDEQGSQPF
jgi:hypothetical protein